MADATRSEPAPRGDPWNRTFLAFVGLHGTLYAAYGFESPFLPSFLGERGLTPGEIGAVLAAGTLVRLAAGPAAGHIADRYDATRMVLAIAAAGAGLVSFGYLAGTGLWFLLLVSMVHAGAIAGLAPLADALALGAVERERTFSYGWVRGAGSAAFILGTLVAGQLVGALGLSSVIVASALAFGLMAEAATRVPTRPRRDVGEVAGFAGIAALLARPLFRRLILVAALVIGSHALNDAFAVITWREAGIGAGTISLLWSAAVASEVVVFVFVGPWLLRRIGPARAAMLAAGAGILRWAIMATTVAVPALASAQLMHGLTFALLHLAAMHLIARSVPEHRAATAQTLYGTLGLGLASAILTGTAGLLYARLGAGAFWIMAALCALALPLASGLRPDQQGRDSAV